MKYANSVCPTGEKASHLILACISWRTLSLPWSHALCTAVEAEFLSSFRGCNVCVLCITPDLLHSGLGRDPILNSTVFVLLRVLCNFLEAIFLLALSRVCTTSIHQWGKLLTLFSLLCKQCILNSQDRSFLRYANKVG